MTVYEMNQQVYKDAPNLPMSTKQDMILKIGNFIDQFEDEYFLALAVDQRYYTVLKVNHEKGHAKLVAQLYQSIENICGPLLDIGVDDGKIEFWYRDEAENTPAMVVLFPYDFGVISE